MTFIPSQPLPVQPHGNWQAAGADQAQTTPAPDTSRIDFVDAGEIGKPDQPGNQFLRVPTGKAADIRSAIHGLDRLNAEDVGSDMFSLLRLLHKCSLEQRAGARLVRQSEMQANIGTLNAAAKEIREAAFQRMLGAVVSGSLQIGSAGLQAYSATQSLKTVATLKDGPEAKIANPAEGTNEVVPQETLKQDIATHLVPGKPAPGQEVTLQLQADSPQTISMKNDRALVLHEEQAGNQKALDSRSLTERSTRIDDQGKLTVLHGDKAALTIEVLEDVPAAKPFAAPPSGTGDPARQAALLNSSSSTETPITEPKPTTDREVTLKELDFQAARLRAASDTTHSAGGVFNAFAQNSAASHDAQKAELEAEAKAHDMANHQASDEVQQTLEQARTWRDMLQGIDQGSIETNRGIARNI